MPFCIVICLLSLFLPSPRHRGSSSEIQGLLKRNGPLQPQPGQLGNHSPPLLSTSSADEVAIFYLFCWGGHCFPHQKPSHLQCYSGREATLVSASLSSASEVPCIQAHLYPTPRACRILPSGGLDFHKFSLNHVYPHSFALSSSLFPCGSEGSLVDPIGSAAPCWGPVCPFSDAQVGRNLPGVLV